MPQIVHEYGKYPAKNSGLFNTASAKVISNTRMKSSSSPGWQIQNYDFLFLIIGQL
jgi:hypothetical protein